MAQSVSLTADLDGYWDIFGPLSGSGYKDHTAAYLIFDPDFDWSTIKNPLSDGFLSARSDATTILGESKVHFINFATYLKKAGELIVKRDADSDFFLSPSNPYIETDSWDYVKSGQKITNILADKIIDSVNNSSIIYMPEENPDINSIDTYSDDANWPTSGLGLNLSKLFEKPLLTVENIIEMESNGEFTIYYSENTDHIKATKETFSPDKSYFIKLKDTTLNGFLVGMNDEIGELLSLPINNNVAYIPVYQSDNDIEFLVLVAHSLYPKGEEFTIEGIAYTSTGSFFSCFLDMMFGENNELSVKDYPIN